MKAYRIAKTKYLSTTLSGYGAREYGGRWNSVGISVVYLSSSIALATLEVLAHTDRGNIPEGSYSVLSVEFPEDAFESLDLKVLRLGWNYSPSPEYLATIGDEWVSRGQKPLLRVPSAIIPREFNYVFNPNHKLANLVIEAESELFMFDPRLN